MDRPRERWKLADGEAGISALCVAVELGRETVALVRGDLDTAAAPFVTRQLYELIAKPIDSLTVDLSEVTFMDSAGLGVLTLVRSHALHHGVRFGLRDSSRFVDQVLGDAGMLAYFDLDPNGQPD
jgi:anti-anti-sigma factor